jgi:hypothetical protein
MKLLVFGALACCISGSSLCGADNETETHGLCNGRFWVSIEESWRAPDGSVSHTPEGSLRGVRLPPGQAAVLLFKMAFVSGVNDALAVSAPQDYYTYHAEGVTIKEIIGGLDAFFKVPENLRVPIVWAMSVVSLRAQGATFENVEKLTAEYRKRAAAEEPALTLDEFMKRQKK